MNSKRAAASPRRVAAIALALTAWGLSGIGGCSHGRTAIRGTSSFQVLDPEKEEPPSGLVAQPASSDLEVRYIPGYFAGKDCPPPVYPVRLLAAGAGTRSVRVTVSFDENGDPVDVSPSRRGVPIPDQFRDGFLTAVREAVSRWKIHPAHLVYYRRGADGTSRYLRTEALSESFDIVFTFAASGEVKAGRAR